MIPDSELRTALDYERGDAAKGPKGWDFVEYSEWEGSSIGQGELTRMWYLRKDGVVPCVFSTTAGEWRVGQARTRRLGLVGEEICLHLEGSQVVHDTAWEALVSFNPLLVA